MMDDCPLNFGNSEIFWRLARRLNPNWKVPLSRTVTRLLTRLMEATKQGMQKVLKRMDMYSLTIDGWSSKIKVSFVKVSLRTPCRVRGDSSFVKEFKPPMKLRLVQWLDSVSRLATQKAMLLSLSDPEFQGI
jgi:hypothetical protein